MLQPGLSYIQTYILLPPDTHMFNSPCVSQSSLQPRSQHNERTAAPQDSLVNPWSNIGFGVYLPYTFLRKAFMLDTSSSLSGPNTR
jgi:hypothetical protein